MLLEEVQLYASEISRSSQEASKFDAHLRQALATTEDDAPRGLNTPRESPIVDRDNARFIARRLAKFLGGSLAIPATEREKRGRTPRPLTDARREANGLYNDLDRPLVELVRVRGPILGRARLVATGAQADRFGEGPSRSLMAMVMYGYLALAVTMVRVDATPVSDREPPNPDANNTPISELERVSDLDDPIRAQLTMAAVESLLQVLRPFRDEQTTPLDPTEWANLDTASRTLELQLRAPRKNVIILSAAFSDALAVIQPHVAVDDPTTLDQAAATVIDDATRLGTDDDSEFGELGAEILTTAATAGAETPWRELARTGIRSAVEPGFHDLTLSLIKAAPTAALTILSGIVAFVEWGTAASGIGAAIASIAVRFVSGLLKRRKGQ